MIHTRLFSLRPKGVFLPLFGRPFVKRFAVCHRSVVLSVCLSCLSVCDVGVLWPNGWTDQDETWHSGRPWPWPHCVRWGPTSHFRKGAQPPIFGPYLLRPNGCMDQDATRRGARPRPRRLCIRWYPAPSQKWGGAPSPIFGPFPLWPNGWMHQDATWYGGRPRSRRHCVRWGPSSPPQNEAEPPPQFSAHVYCGQTAGWIKVALGMEVGLVPATLC